jgi:hypothetical protein
LRHEQHASGRELIAQSPPMRPLEIREHALWFLAEYPNTVCDARIGLSPRALFQEYRRQRILKLDFDHRDDSHVPATWSEYQTLMADEGTYPDIILLHAIARLYRCQIVLYVRDDAEVPYAVIAPPDAFRRIFLFTTAHLKSANWAHPVDDDNDGEDITFQAPPLAPPPDALTPHDDALHSLYNRQELSDERLDVMYVCECVIAQIQHLHVQHTLHTQNIHKFQRLQKQPRRLGALREVRLRLRAPPLFFWKPQELGQKRRQR